MLLSLKLSDLQYTKSIFAHCLKILLVFVISQLNLSASDSDLKQNSSFLKPFTLRIYLLHSSVNRENLEESLSDNIKGRTTTHPCQINPGSVWYRKKKETIPEFWRLVQQGTGMNLCDLDQPNTEENWLYYIETNGQKFGIILGKGCFFKTQKDGEESCIDSRYGDSKFGTKVSRNLDFLIKLKGASTTYQELGLNISELRGRDCCSITLKCNDLRDLAKLCKQIWNYAEESNASLLSSLREEAIRLGKTLVDVTADIPSPSKEEMNEDQQEIEYETQGVTKTAVRSFDRFWTYEGFEDYSEATRQKIRELIDDACINLPEFKRSLLENKSKTIITEREDEVLEELPSSTKRRRIDYEGLYNQQTTQERDLILLDKECIENVEVCDLFDQNKRILVHVKIGTASADLNHLFGQGLASASLLRNRDYRKRIPAEISRKLVNRGLKRKTSDTTADKSINDCYDQAFSSLSGTEIDFKTLCEKILELYEKKKGKKIYKAELQQVMDSHEILKIYNDLQKGFPVTITQPLTYGLVYAIVTDKDPHDKNLLPIGARINLLKNVENLQETELGQNISFKIYVKIVPDQP